MPKSIIYNFCINLTNDIKIMSSYVYIEGVYMCNENKKWSYNLWKFRLELGQINIYVWDFIIHIWRLGNGIFKSRLYSKYDLLAILNFVLKLYLAKKKEIPRAPYLYPLEVVTTM